MKRTRVCRKCQGRRFSIQGELQGPDEDSLDGVEPSPLYATSFQSLDVAPSQGRVRFFDASAPQGHAYR